MKIIVLLDSRRKAIYNSKMPPFKKEVFDLYTKTPRGVKKSTIILINNNGVWEEHKEYYHYAPSAMTYGKESRYNSIGEGTFRAKTILY